MNKLMHTDQQNIKAPCRGMVLHEKVTLLSIFAMALLPIKNIPVLQVLALLHFLLFLVLIGRHKKFLILFAFGYLNVLVLLNIHQVFNSVEFIKPLWGIMALLVVFHMQEQFSECFFKRFLEISFALLLLFILFRLMNLTAILDLFRVTSQGDLIHRDRLTAPFLFAGDYGVVCLFLAMLSFSIGEKKGALLGVGFVVLLLFSQSRLALAGLPFIVLISPRMKYKIVLIFVAVTVGIYIYYNADIFFKIFPYVSRFFEKSDYYLMESKRSIEYQYLYLNFTKVLFSGTEDFVLEGGWRTIESSIISYTVKSGFIMTVVFWTAAFIFSHIYLNRGFPALAAIFFLSLLAAPLDRPKSSVFIAVTIAGISIFNGKKIKLNINQNRARFVGRSNLQGSESVIRNYSNILRK